MAKKQFHNDALRNLPPKIAANLFHFDIHGIQFHLFHIDTMASLHGLSARIQLRPRAHRFRRDRSRKHLI